MSRGTITLTTSDTTHDFLRRRVAVSSRARPGHRCQSTRDDFPGQGIRKSILSPDLYPLPGPGSKGGANPPPKQPVRDGISNSCHFNVQGIFGVTRDIFMYWIMLETRCVCPRP